MLILDEVDKLLSSDFKSFAMREGVPLKEVLRDQWELPPLTELRLSYLR